MKAIFLSVIGDPLATGLAGPSNPGDITVANPPNPLRRGLPECRCPDSRPDHRPAPAERVSGTSVEARLGPQLVLE